MNLPIDVVKHSRPMRFRWTQTIDTLLGRKTVNCEGSLQQSVEQAIADLISLAKQQAKEIAQLKDINQGFADRIAKQSDQLSKNAERHTRGKSKAES